MNVNLLKEMYKRILRIEEEIKEIKYAVVEIEEVSEREIKQLEKRKKEALKGMGIPLNKALEEF